MIDANTWVAVGANGTFMRTTDAGVLGIFINKPGFPQTTPSALVRTTISGLSTGRTESLPAIGDLLEKQRTGE